MERRRARRSPPGGTVVLDSGAVIAWSRREDRVREFIQAGMRDQARLVVPAIVVAETYRGGSRDTRIDYLLARAEVPGADLDLAREAGRLLGRTGGSNAGDALVVAEALRQAPCVLVTGDPNDLRMLIGHAAGVEVLDLNAL